MDFMELSTHIKPLQTLSNHFQPYFNTQSIKKQVQISLKSLDKKVKENILKVFSVIFFNKNLYLVAFYISTTRYRIQQKK